jgi:hypothetical protein
MKQDAELLLLQLLMDGYLQELFVQTAYTVICQSDRFETVWLGLMSLSSAYIKPGSGAPRLTRWKEDQLATCGLKVELTTLGPVKPKRGSKKKKEKDDNDEEQEPPKKTRKKNNAKDLAGLPSQDTTAKRIALIRAARSSSPMLGNKADASVDEERSERFDFDSDDENEGDSQKVGTSKDKAGDRSIIEID